MPSLDKASRRDSKHKRTKIGNQSDLHEKQEDKKRTKNISNRRKLKEVIRETEV